MSFNRLLFSAAVRSSTGPAVISVASRPLLAITALSRARLLNVFTHRHDGNEGHGASGTFSKSALLAIAFIASYGVETSLCEEPQQQQHKDFGNPVKGLKTYKAEEVRKHNAEGQSVWVTFKEGVYDITNFINEHPGGKEKIMMAAGGAVDDFWKLYRQHLQLPEISHMLEEMRIGNLDPDDYANAHSHCDKKEDDPFRFDPDDRHPALQFRSQHPCNAESPPELLVDAFDTPSPLFFVRNHFPVPPPPEREVVSFGGGGLAKPVEITVEELKSKFEQHTVHAVIQCAGNRRSEFNNHLEGKPPVKGLSWTLGAISNAYWRGPLLKDVLEYIYGDLSEEIVTSGHAHFWGRDGDGENNYGASVPAGKVFSKSGDVILALEMNGEPLSVDHGWPVRVVVPGTAGARNVKWLSRVSLEKEESPSFWQKNDYKFLQEHTDAEEAQALQTMPVTSAICYPKDGATVQLDEHGEVVCKGYAYSGGGRRIKEVDVSVDGGRTWSSAVLEEDPDDTGEFGRSWSWVLWSAVVSKPSTESQALVKNVATSEGDVIEIIVRAIDDANNTQPEKSSTVWNVRGLVNNSWHRVRIRLQQQE